MKRFWLVNKKQFNRNILPVQLVIFVPSSFPYQKALRTLLIGIAILICININAQQSDAEYRKVITERSAKIVNTLEIRDSVKYNKVLNEIVEQYAQINATHEQNKTAINDLKAKTLSKEEMAEAVSKQEEKKSSLLLQRHTAFIAHLKENLSEEQLEKVKDGMTYRVFPITYAGYLDMLPTLTTEQKEKIYAWLKEARELAMDGESSEKKHAVFGKYKGKINNYLSAAGFDMKKEGEEWQKRIKERDAAKKQSLQ